MVRVRRRLLDAGGPLIDSKKAGTGLGYDRRPVRLRHVRVACRVAANLATYSLHKALSAGAVWMDRRKRFGVQC
jgi:hypothetical protein